MDFLVLSDALKSNGYFLLRDFFSDSDVSKIQKEFFHLESIACQLLHELQSTGAEFGRFYQKNSNKLLVVQERDNTSALCRFEHITPNSTYFNDDLLPKIFSIMHLLLGDEVSLFKDKCNLKYPGGGEFSAHQDIPAYINFGPNFFLTAAVFVDETTMENGALEFCSNFASINDKAEINCKNLTPFGYKRVLGYEVGGENNGQILEEHQKEMMWQTVLTKPKDLLIFDSYVPHRSAKNMSQSARSVFFFTFCPAKYGNIYEAYYAKKMRDSDNPIFHVGTPTKFDETYNCPSKL